MSYQFFSSVGCCIIDEICIFSTYVYLASIVILDDLLNDIVLINSGSILNDCLWLVPLLLYGLDQNWKDYVITRI